MCACRIPLRVYNFKSVHPVLPPGEKNCAIMNMLHSTSSLYFSASVSHFTKKFGFYSRRGAKFWKRFSSRAEQSFTWHFRKFWNRSEKIFDPSWWTKIFDQKEVLHIGPQFLWRSEGLKTLTVKFSKFDGRSGQLRLPLSSLLLITCNVWAFVSPIL